MTHARANWKIDDYGRKLESIDDLRDSLDPTHYNDLRRLILVEMKARFSDDELSLYGYDLNDDA